MYGIFSNNAQPQSQLIGELFGFALYKHGFKTGTLVDLAKNLNTRYTSTEIESYNDLLTYRPYFGKDILSLENIINTSGTVLIKERMIPTISEMKNVIQKFVNNESTGIVNDKLLLYTPGDEYISLTGGYYVYLQQNTSVGYTFTKSNKSMYLCTEATTFANKAVCSTNAIDITNWNYIVFNLKAINGRFATNVGIIDENKSNEIVVSINPSQDMQTVKINISDKTGMWYPMFRTCGSYTNGTSIGDIEIFNIYLFSAIDINFKSIFDTIEKRNGYSDRSIPITVKKITDGIDTIPCITEFSYNMINNGIEIDPKYTIDLLSMNITQNETVFDSITSVENKNIIASGFTGITNTGIDIDTKTIKFNKESNQYLTLPNTGNDALLGYTVAIVYKTTDVRSCSTFYNQPALFSKITSGSGLGDVGICVKDGYLYYWDDVYTTYTSTEFVADGNIHIVVYSYKPSFSLLYTENGFINSFTSSYGKSDVPYNIFVSIYDNDSSSILSGELYGLYYWDNCIDNRDVISKLTRLLHDRYTVLSNNTPSIISAGTYKPYFYNNICSIKNSIESLTGNLINTVDAVPTVSEIVTAISNIDIESNSINKLFKMVDVTGFTITASSNISGNTNIINAFNNSFSTNLQGGFWSANSGGSATSGIGEWFMVESPTPIVINTIEIFARSDGYVYQTPVGYKIEGSNNGITWYIIDYVYTGIFVNLAQSSINIFENTKKYTHYKFTVVKINPNNTTEPKTVSINEIKLYEIEKEQTINANSFRFRGNTYIDTLLDPSTSMTTEWSVNMRVQLNLIEVNSVAYMNLCGYHYGNNGFVAQVSNGNLDNIPIDDIANDTWVDITWVYKDNIMTVYINGRKIVDAYQKTISPLDKFFIGNGFMGNSRAMKGFVSDTTIWNTALDPVDIKYMRHSSLKKNMINPESILYHIDANNFTNIFDVENIVGYKVDLYINGVLKEEWVYEWVKHTDTFKTTILTKPYYLIMAGYGSTRIFIRFFDSVNETVSCTYNNGYRFDGVVGMSGTELNLTDGVLGTLSANNNLWDTCDKFIYTNCQELEEVVRLANSDNYIEDFTP